MSTPNVTITKGDGNTGVVRPAADGVCVIIAPCEKGTKNQPASHTSDRNAQTEFGDGPLTEWAAHVISMGGKSVVLIRSEGTTVGVYSAVTTTNGGTSVITADASVPLDDYEVAVEFKSAGTIGVAGITYRYSLDDGRTWSGVLALGTATAIAIPQSGVGFALAAGTILATTSFKCTTTGPRMTNGDLVAALEALRVSGQPWEAVLVHGEATSTLVGTLGAWIASQNAKGKFRTGLMNTRMKNSGEAESAYSTAMATATAAMSSIDVVIGTDGTRLPSPLRGFVRRIPAAVAIAGRGMLIDIAEDPAYVERGPIPAATILDDRLNPRDHDEDKFPGLDALRLSTLRSIEGEFGVFITNARLISPAGSDYVFWQHARVMNAGCEVLHQILQKKLSVGVRKDPATGKILEEEAQALEGLATAGVDRRLVNRVSGSRVVISRDDDLSSNEGATLSATLEISAIAYVKGFAVVAKFVRKITAAAA